MPRRILRPASLEFQSRPTFPYSPAAKAGGLVITSGQAAWDNTGRLVGIGDVRAQTRQTLQSVRSVPAEGGAGPGDILKCNVYLREIQHFQTMSENFARAFPSGPPVRTTARTMRAEPQMPVEIEAIAWGG